jgi:Ca2+-binding EF-hand superfamily protein
LFPKKVELQALIKYYDLDGDGSICYEEFIRGLRDELTERRKRMVEKVFLMLDKDKSGFLSVQDLVNIYDVSINPEYIEGRKTKDQILTEFLINFEGVRGNKDGKVSKEEFFDYYTDLSMSVPSDEYFVRIMESTWQIPEVEDPSTKSVVQMLIKEVRTRLLQLAKNDPKLLRKVFSDFDLNQSNHLTIDEVTNMVAKLKISVERRMVYPFFKVVDANNSGGIEYDEFEKYLLENPY